MLKAVVFDVDGVLTDSLDANVDFYRKLLPKVGFPAPSYEAVAACNHMTLENVLRTLVGPIDDVQMKRIWEAVHNDNLYDVGLLAFPDKLREILDDLHKHYLLGIVTARSRLGIGHVVERGKLEGLFDALIGINDYMHPKPHPEPLLKACNALHIQPSEAIYIGDSSSDIETAKAAGMKNIHLAAQPHPDATAHVRVFADLPDVIRKLAV